MAQIGRKMAPKASSQIHLIAIPRGFNGYNPKNEEYALVRLNA
jgi:hypothetical protein